MSRTQQFLSSGTRNTLRSARIRRAVAVGAILAATAGALTGCATNNSGSGDGGAVTLTVNVWSDWTFVQSAADEFKKTHSDVNFKFNAIPDGTYWTKIPGLFKTADTPDISAIPIDADHYPDFSKASLLAPLDSAWTDSGLEANSSDAVQKIYTQDGHKYAIPVGGSAVPVIYYNKDLFKEAGITDVPQTGMTMDEFYTIAEKLNAKNIAPLASGLNDGNGAFRYFAPVFASVCGADWETKAASGDQSAWKDSCVAKGLEVVSQWKDKKVFAGGSAAGTSTSSVAEATFAAGKSGMEMEGTWAVGAIRKGNAKMNLGWFQMPSATGDAQKIAVSNIDALAVASGSKHQKQATEFLTYLANYAGVWQHGIPARSDLTAPSGTDSVLTDVASDTKDGAAPALDQTTKSDLITTINNAIIAVVVGQKSASAAAGVIAAGV